MADWLNVLLRSVGLFVLLFTLVRLLGKKHPSKMTPFRFVNFAVLAVITSLIVSNVIANPALGLIAIGVWVLLPIAGEHLAVRSKVVHDLLYGKETVIIRKGKVMEENLRETRLSTEELLSELRSKNVFNLADVEFAVLESDGNINVLLKSEKTPVTPYDMGWKIAPRVEPQTLIVDGNILNDRLNEIGLNRRWLKEQLESAGVLLDNVFIGQVDSLGDLYLDLFDDSLETPQPKVKDLLYANLEKAEAELAAFALETENRQAKETYSSHAGKLKEIKEKLKPYLLR